MKQILTTFLILQSLAFALRLLGVVDWPWQWVLLPLLTLLFFAFMLFAIGVTIIIAMILSRLRGDNQQEEGGEQ